MNSRQSTSMQRVARVQGGFTLVELMIAMAIALFLLGGLMTILQNVRGAYNNQQALAQLQDQQRFTMMVLTDVIQAGGYFPDPVAWTPIASLPAAPPYNGGQAFWGTYVAGGGDTIGVRYRTAIAPFNDPSGPMVVCDGSTNTARGPSYAYTNTFSVRQPVGTTPGALLCQVDNLGAAAAAGGGGGRANGVVGMQIYYGVKRDFTVNDYNVDTYLRADQMAAASCTAVIDWGSPTAGCDWANVAAVRVILTFTNPLFGQANQPATVTFERVIEVMARAGLHT
jgi:type IV pilus assembly protein PilW